MWRRLRVILTVLILGNLSLPGQSGLFIHHRADSGTSTTTHGATVSQWNDLSGAAYHSILDHGTPTFDTLVSNFHPGIYFPHSSAFQLTDAIEVQKNDADSITMAIVFKTSNDIDTTQVIVDNGDRNKGIVVFIRRGYLVINVYPNGVNYADSTAIDTNRIYLLTFVLDASTGWEGYLNGERRLAVASPAPGDIIHWGHKQQAALGGWEKHYIDDYGVERDITNSAEFKGHLQEFMWYYQDARIGTERMALEGMLALKYGIQLSNDCDADGIPNELVSGSIREGDYLAPDGSTIVWSHLSQGTDYYHSVAGIGRYDFYNQNQKQSHSETDSALITIGLGDIYGTNAANPNTFTYDPAVLLWAHNNAPLVFSIAGAPAPYKKIERSWRVQETGVSGNVGTVKLRVPASTSSLSPRLPYANKLSIITDADGDFSSGATTTEMTLNGDYWEVDIDFNGGDYFTFCTYRGTTLSTSVHGDEDGPTAVEFSMNLHDINTTGVPITFDFADAGTGTASVGSDYIAIPGGSIISVAPGDSMGYFTVPVIDNASWEGDVSLISYVSNPSDPEYFIFTDTATAIIYENELPAPGNIRNQLSFWLKANQGTSSSTDGAAVSNWYDQTANGNDATALASTPTYSELSTNYNPGVDFDGYGGFSLDNSSSINTSAFSEKSFSIVFRTGEDISSYQVLYEEGNYSDGLNCYIANNKIYCNLWVASADNYGSAAIESNTDYLLTFIYNGASSRMDAYLNGVLAFSDLSAPASIPALGGGIGIGVINDSTRFGGGLTQSSGAGFNGQIMELAYFAGNALNSADRQQLESYMGVKYAISLPSDYLAGDGSIVWDASLNSSHGNAVTGIGYQLSAALNQKQSGSSASGRLVSIGLDTIVSSNAANSASYNSDQSYLLWGHNDGPLSFVVNGAPADSMILNRSYRVQKTGSIGSTRVRIAGHSSSESIKLPPLNSLNLLVDSDGDFSSGASIIPMTLLNGYWEAIYEFSNGDYFSFSFQGGLVWVSQEGDENGPTNIRFELRTPTTSGSILHYDITVLGSSTADSASDYSLSTPLRFEVAIGDTAASYSVSVVDDLLEEPLEYLSIAVDSTINLSNPLNFYRLNAYITDNDAGYPGVIGVTPDFWLRADDSTSTTTDGNPLSNWYDVSGNGHDASSTGAGPLFEAVGCNFNPALAFSAASGGMLIADALALNSYSGGYRAKSLTVAFKTASDISTLQVIYEQGGSDDGFNLYLENDQLRVNWWAASSEYSAAVSINAQASYVASFIYDGNAGRWDLYLNGALASSQLSVPSVLNGSSDNIGLGAVQGTSQFDGGRDLSSNQPFLGSIMEVLYFNDTVLSSNQRGRLESYLSLKYGAAYQADILASDSSLIWDATANASYLGQLSGIGWDLKAGLDQRQSFTNDSPSQVLTIGLKSIASSNASNSNSFTNNKNFLIWGHNGGNLTGVDSASSLPAQSGLVDRFDRVWHIEETGSVDTVQLAFPKDSIDQYMSDLPYGELYLRIADDAALTTNVVDTPFYLADINGVSSYVVEYDFSSAHYFSIIRKGFIWWNGYEWRGGLSAITPHGPSDDPLDQLKIMLVDAGDTATITEAVVVDSTIIDSAAILQVNPTACLRLNSISNSGSFILHADASGFGQYKGPATNATFEQYIDDYGWHLIGSPFSDTQWRDFNFKNDNGATNHPLGGSSLDSCDYCNLWWYDASTDNGTDIGFGSSDAFGTWRSSTDSNQGFIPDRGWNLYLDTTYNFATAPWTVSVNGTFNNGAVSQQVNENNAGWNLVANPYPSALDWDTIDNDLAAAGIAAGYHVWDHENTNYAVYAGGSGTLGLSRYIAPFQGFYVQTAVAGAQNSANVFHSFDLENADRPDDCPGGLGNFYKSSGGNEIVLRSTHRGSKKVDETIIRLKNEATREFDSWEDIRKLASPYRDAPNLFTLSGKAATAINVLPHPAEKDSLPLGVWVAQGSPISIEAIKAPPGYTIYLEDLKDGSWHAIGNAPYQFTQDNSLPQRFILHFGPISFKADPWLAGKPFYVFTEGAYLNVKTLKLLSGKPYQVASSNGTVLKSGYLGEGQQHKIYIGDLPAGVYIYALWDGERHYSEKIIKL